MARVASALAKAENLVKFPDGRYHFDFPLIWLGTIVADLQKASKVATTETPPWSSGVLAPASSASFGSAKDKKFTAEGAEGRRGGQR
jgi:hypothetical protein